jgi:hypothetical protein
MLHLHAVSEPDRITLRSPAFYPMQELVTRLMLMRVPFEYRREDHWHIITSMAEARSALGSPTFENVDSIIVEEG